jgi:SAM-dependent methyltransferase
MGSRDFNSSRARLQIANAAFAAEVPAGSMVLDAGAGEAPYEPLFRHANYEAADFARVPGKKYSSQTYICDLASIPVEDARYDFVVFNQVMEHLPDPLLVLNELKRVLKPGGRMIYSAPFFYEEHEKPYDFYRYTQFGVRHLFDKAGFAVEKLEWLEGYFGSLGYQLGLAASYLPHRPTDYGGGLLGAIQALLAIPLKLQMRFLGKYFHRLEMRHKYTKRGFPKNYVAIVRKNSTPAT